MIIDAAARNDRIVVEELRDTINSMPNYVLLAYQKVFNGIGNIKYFENMRNKFKNYNWNKFKIEHLPENSYLISVLK